MDFCQHCFKHFALWTFTSVAFKVKSLSAGFPHITLFNAAHFKGDSDDDADDVGGNDDGDYDDMIMTTKKLRMIIVIFFPI